VGESFRPYGAWCAGGCCRVEAGSTLGCTRTGGGGRRAITCREGCVGEAYWNLGLVVRAREQYLEALERFRAALAVDPDYTAAQEALVDVEQGLFNFPDA
jgi:hypothetical protein